MMIDACSMDTFSFRNGLRNMGISGPFIRERQWYTLTNSQTGLLPDTWNQDLYSIVIRYCSEGSPGQTKQYLFIEA